MYRRPVNESELPKIPAQAISYGDAMELLQRMGGNRDSFCCMLKKVFLKSIKVKRVKCALGMRRGGLIVGALDPGPGCSKTD